MGLVKLPRLQPRINRFTVGLFVLLALSVLLITLEWNQGFVAQEFAFLGTRGMIARMESGSSFGAVGLAFPPLLVYATALLGSPVTVQVLLAALLVSWMYAQSSRWASSRLWQWLWLMLIALNPAFSLMLLRSPSWTATTLVLGVVLNLLFSLITITSVPLKPGQPQAQAAILPLVLLGFAIAPLMLLRWEAWFLIPAIALIAALIFQAQDWGLRWTALIVVSFLSLTVMGAWLYINWLGTGDPFAFLRRGAIGIRLPYLQPWMQQARGFESWVQGLSWLLRIVPVYAVAVGWVLWCNKRRGILSLSLLLPLLMLVVSLWRGIYIPEVSRFGLFLGLLPVLFSLSPPHRSWQRFSVTGMLGLSLFLSSAALQNGVFIPEETALWWHLTGQSVSLKPPVQATPTGNAGELSSGSATGRIAAQDWIGRQRAERYIGDVLSKSLSPRQHVLVDDQVHFPVLYWMDAPQALITPHQNTFQVALQQPATQVAFILVAAERSPLANQDQIRQFWPQLAHTPVESLSLSSPDWPNTASEDAAVRLELLSFSEVASTPYVRLLQQQ